MKQINRQQQQQQKMATPILFCYNSIKSEQTMWGELEKKRKITNGKWKENPWKLEMESKVGINGYFDPSVLIDWYNKSKNNIPNWIW